jgi:hypothetical protein
MATLSGTNASVKLGTTLVADMANWSIDDTKDALTAPVFGDTMNKVHGMGTRNVSGTVSGYLNIADTTGQELLKDAYDDGTAITDFRLYVDETYYFKGTEVYITSYSTSAAQNEIIPITFNFVASENWIRTSG